MPGSPTRSPQWSSAAAISAPESPTGASGSRSRWSPPTRPARSRSPLHGTAPTATRSPVSSSSPGTRSSASTTTTTPAHRWRRSGPRSRRDDEDRVLIRSPDRGGGPTYRAADVLYLADKLERGFDRAIYVLGADHHGTRNWYAAVARMLGYDPDRIEVLLYQLVHLTSGGQQRKMSKRRGDVVFLDDFMDEVGVDAARWYLVNRGPDQAIDIDVDLAAEKSRKNPVYYVQYSHARCAGIFREAADAEVGGAPSAPLEPEER